MQTSTKEVVKVAIKANNTALLYTLDQTLPLETVIKEVCVKCSVGYEANQYALQLIPLSTEPDVFLYITEHNRYKVKNGSELKLVYSPNVLAKMIKNKLSSKVSVDNLAWALRKAAVCSVDSTFCKEFFTSGYPELQTLLVELLPTVDLFLNSLQIIINLIKTQYLKSLDRSFLLQLKEIITSDQHIDEGIIEKALGILEAIVLASGDSEIVSSLLNLDDFIHHIWSRGSPAIQGNALALINAMVLKSSKVKTQRCILKQMNSKPLKDNIYMNIISADTPVTPALANALYVYQSLILTLEKERYRNTVKSEPLLSSLLPHLKSEEIKIETKKEIEAELFCYEAVNKNISHTKPAKQLRALSSTTSVTSSILFDSDDDEIDELDFIPETKHEGSKKEKYISQLAFDCLLYFYNKHGHDYKIALLDDGNSYSKLLHTCEQIVQILCLKILHIGDIPEFGETNYCPLVFNTALPFIEELFSKTINLLHKTKREMKARSPSDLDKVYQVLQRQLSEGLATRPVSFDQLESVLGTLSYWTVRSQWEEEQEKREQHTLANSPAVKQLKESLVGEIKDLVKKQRLQFVKNKTEFPVWNAQRNQRVKNKTWFAFLMPNEKAIQYYENEGEMQQILVQNITSLLTGKRCPHIKYSKSRATNGELAFSLVVDESSLDFIAPTQEIYDHWTDAINVLLGKEMKSICMKRDMNCLMEMELRLRLLDIDGIDIPTEPPPVPLDPPNYNFCCVDPR